MAWEDMKHAARFGNGAYLAEEVEKSFLGGLFPRWLDDRWPQDWGFWGFLYVEVRSFKRDLLCSSVSCHFLKLACSQHLPKCMPKLTWNALDAWSQGKWLKFNSKGQKVLSFVLNISWSLEESHISAAFGCFYGCWCHSHRWGSPMPSQIRMVSDAWLRDGVTGGCPLNTVGRLGIHRRHMKIWYSKYTYMHRHAYIRT